MMSGSDGMTFGGFWLMFLVGILLVALLGVVLYVAVRAGNPPAPSSARMGEPEAPSPREVLDLRLARGEVSPEEYSAARPLLDP